MTKSHIMYVTFLTFRDGIKQMNTKDPKIQENLYNLCKLFALNELMIDSSACYETEYFKARTGLLIMDTIKHLMTLIRP
jgi:Acyl-CoA oxidase